MTQHRRLHRPSADQADEPDSPRRRTRGRPWWHIAAPAAGGLLVVGAVVCLLFLRGDVRPTVEVIHHRAEIKAGTAVLTHAVLGDCFKVLDVNGNWYQVNARVKDTEQRGWINAADVRPIDTGSGKPPETVQVQITEVAYPDMVGTEPTPYGRRWLLIEATVRPLTAEPDGTYPVRTDQFVATLGPNRYANPRYCQVTVVRQQRKESLARKAEVLRIPKDEAKSLVLVFDVPRQIVIQQGWKLRYVPPPPGSIPAAPPRAAPKAGTNQPTEE